MSQDTLIRDAVTDLATIREAIETAHSSSVNPSNHYALDAALLLHGVILGVSTLLIGVELSSNHFMTANMMSTRSDSELGVLGLTQVALVILSLLLCIYFLAWRSAQHSQQSFQSYISRNFSYLRRLGLLSDLVVKFVPLSLLVLGGHPEWVSPLLSLYLTDTLIQGQFFVLPIQAAYGLAFITLGFSVVQFYAHSSLLIWPLIQITGITVLSLLYLFKLKKRKITFQAK